MIKILIVDDEESVLRILSTLFKTRGFEPSTASDGEDAMALLDEEKFDILLTDVRMRPMDGLALLKYAHHHDPEMPVVMLTAYASVESAIEALKHGAFDYITKPFDVGQLVGTVDRALAFRNGTSHETKQQGGDEVTFVLDEIIAESPSMRDVCEKVKKIAAADTIVSIMGEAGCGKGLLARALHNHSKRKDKQFYSVNCAVIPEPLLEAELLGYVSGALPGVEGDKKGLFEQVRGGTLFMEEIGSLPMRLQEVLMKILQEKKVCRLGGKDPVSVSTRVIASSNSDLESVVKRGGFREDLFYRLNVVSLRVKPLRERVEDIVPVFAFCLGKVLEGNTDLPEIPPETQAVLKSYSWIGNCEELENAAVFAANNLKKNAVTRDSLPPKIACTPVNPGVMESEPMQARSLKAFLLAEGADKDLAAAEKEVAESGEDAGA